MERSELETAIRGHLDKILEDYGDMTLTEAREHLVENLLDLQWREDARCLSCGQRTQLAKWPLYGTAVRALFMFYRLGGTTQYVPQRRLGELGHRGTGDQARLRLWGLMEESGDRRQDGGKAGEWRVTKKGEKFLFDHLTIPKYAYVYDHKVATYEGPEVNCFDCLGKNFNVAEFLAGII